MKINFKLIYPFNNYPGQTQVITISLIMCKEVCT